MKKILLITVSLSICIILLLTIVVTGVSEQFGQLLSYKKDEEVSTESGTCKYVTSNEIVFDERTEKVRSEFERQLNPYFLNIAMALYQTNDKLRVQDIVKEISVWNMEYDIAANLQDYKYNHKYITYLKSTGEEHSLLMSKKYYNLHKDEYKADEHVYSFYLNVMSIMDKNCEYLVSDGEYTTPLKQPFVITQPFGVAHIYGDVHFGIDLSSSYGAPIFAVTTAIVDKAEETCPPNGGYLGNMCNLGQGNYVQLSVKDGENTIYITTMHMKSVDVKAGDQVTIGQKIGEQGHSGNSTASHVHIEFRKVPNVSLQLSDFLDPNKYIDFFKQGE